MGNTISYEEAEHRLDLGKKGCITGLQYDSKSRRYAGIPYALPPMEDHRWRKPRPLPINHSYSSPGGQPFDATKFGPICPQETNYTSANKHGSPETIYGEDCLRLNIWTPVEAPDEGNGKWPVMLWLHGGWFQIGDPSHEPGMNPTEMISTGKLNAIVVAIGYRLNIFGFLAGEALKDEAAGEVGNYGLWDQRLAIEWVHENISSFGGDSENVTLAGRSAGAYSVHAQTLFEFQNTSVQTNGCPFRCISMISNAIPAQPKSPEECQEQFDEVCRLFEIPSTLSNQEKLSSLRKLDADTLVESVMQLKHHTFRPVTDSSFILPGMIEYHRDGAFASEFNKLTNGPEANAESLRLQINNYYSSTTTTRILQHYKIPETDDRKEWTTLYGNIIADGQVRAPSRFLVNSLLEHGASIMDIWRYRIAYRLSFINEKVAPKEFGVSHAMDKPFWNFSTMHGPTEKELVLMKEWIRNLVAFVQAEDNFTYGTTRVDEFKVATPESRIEIQTDERWQELLSLAEVFSG